MADDGGLAPRALNQIAQSALPPSAAEPEPLPLPLTAADDLYQLLRRLESRYPAAPRIGRAIRLAQEVVRLGQEPSLAFAPGPIASVRAPTERKPFRLLVNCFGLLGPNGPLPLHLTEYVRQREKHNGDSSLARFLDLFHHRMLSFFYRAWADAQPAVQCDRAASDRFAVYVGALQGIGMPSLRDRDALPDPAKLYYAGRFAAQVRNAAGLTDLLSDYFALPTEVEEFVGEWVEIPDGYRWRVGDAMRAPDQPLLGRLGESTHLGSRVWLRQSRFRIVLGPLTRAEFDRVAPGGAALAALVALVRGYAGDELKWDLRLKLKLEAVPDFQLGASSLGQSTWLGGGAALAPSDDLVFDPQAETARRDAMSYM
ncbi:MAG TPA: type VI secretion system baseplate subunit TssG [Polyangiales bacterium]